MLLSALMRAIPFQHRRSGSSEVAGWSSAHNKPARNAPSLAARAGILLKNLLDMEGFVEPAAYRVHRLNALQLGNTSLHTCNGFFSFINRVLLLIQVILALLGSKRRNVAALTTIKNGRYYSSFFSAGLGECTGYPASSSRRAFATNSG